MIIENLSSVTKLMVNISVLSTIAAITLLLILLNTSYNFISPRLISLLFFIPIILIPSVANGKIVDVILYYVFQFIIITGILGF